MTKEEKYVGNPNSDLKTDKKIINKDFPCLDNLEKEISNLKIYDKLEIHEEEGSDFLTASSKEETIKINTSSDKNNDESDRSRDDDGKEIRINCSNKENHEAFVTVNKGADRTTKLQPVINKNSDSSDEPSEDSNSDDESSDDGNDKEAPKEDETLSLNLTNLSLRDSDESNESSSDDSEEDDDKEKEIYYLTRSPLINHTIHGFRYSPFPHHGAPMSNNYGHCKIPNRDGSSGDNELLNHFYPDGAGAFGQFNQELLSPGNFPSAPDNYYSSAQLSPESTASSVNSSPCYVPNYPQYSVPSPYGGQTEFSTQEQTHFIDTSFNFGSKSYDMFQPISPPQSVSPLLKDGQDTSFGPPSESENLRESEDLINIINTVNETSRTEQQTIPETELLKLCHLLDENESSIRDEMGIYLKEGNHFEHPFNGLEKDMQKELASDFDCDYGGILTPPKSVSPIQETLSYGSPSSPSSDVFHEDLSSYNDFLEGIDEVNPDELNIYLYSEKINSDLSEAKDTIHGRCGPNKLDYAVRRLSSLSEKSLCKQDEDGDTCLMIVYSKPEDSRDFYENIYCVQEKLKDIKLCCNTPLGKAKKCKPCGNKDPSKFYTPLSLKNTYGDTALSCAMKTNHSPVIINYLLDGILQCEQDLCRVFDEEGCAMFLQFCSQYPCLNAIHLNMCQVSARE